MIFLKIGYQILNEYKIWSIGRHIYLRNPDLLISKDILFKLLVFRHEPPSLFGFDREISKNEFSSAFSFNIREDIKNFWVVSAFTKVILLACTPEPQRFFLNILQSLGKTPWLQQILSRLPAEQRGGWPQPAELASRFGSSKTGLAWLWLLWSICLLRSPSRSTGGQGLSGSGTSAGCHKQTGYLSQSLGLAHKVTSIAIHFWLLSV